MSEQPVVKPLPLHRPPGVCDGCQKPILPEEGRVIRGNGDAYHESCYEAYLEAQQQESRDQ